MSALSRFEQFVEQLFEGGFTRLLRSQLQPVEIAKRLERVMEDSQAIGAGGRIIVANRYEILLHPQDFSLFEPYKSTLERELAEYAGAAAKERRYSLANRAMVVLLSSERAMPKRPLVKGIKSDAGPMDIASAGNEEEQGVSPKRDPLSPDNQTGLDRTSRLNINLRPRGVTRTSGYLRLAAARDAERIPINRSPFTIGRELDNDLVLEDKRISRHHARIEELSKRLLLVDLESTNGTSVNGDAITRSLLSDGDVVSLGGVDLVVAVEDRN